MVVLCRSRPSSADTCRTSTTPAGSAVRRVTGTSPVAQGWSLAGFQCFGLPPPRVWVRVGEMRVSISRETPEPTERRSTGTGPRPLEPTETLPSWSDGRLSIPSRVPKSLLLSSGLRQEPWQSCPKDPWSTSRTIVRVTTQSQGGTKVTRRHPTSRWSLPAVPNILSLWQTSASGPTKKVLQLKISTNI